MVRFQDLYRPLVARPAQALFSGCSFRPCRALATLSEAQLGPPPKGYEIDPISLKKVYLGQPPSKTTVSEPTEETSWTKFRFPQTADILVEPNTAAEIVKNIKYERVRLEHNDRASGYLSFVENYVSELQELRSFVRKSYDKKITEFSQLTSVELSNCVYIFKDAISRGSVSNGRASYKKMAKTLLKFLTNDQKFTKALSYDLLPAVGADSSIVNLYARGITRYEKHLRQLCGDVDFHSTSLAAVIGAVDARIGALEKALNGGPEEASFFKDLIALHRYEQLRALLHKTQASPMDLWSIIEDPDLKIIDTSIWALSGKESVLTDFMASYPGRLSFVSGHLLSDTTDDAHFLFSLHRNSRAGPTVNGAKEGAVNLSVLQELLPMACSGIEHIAQKIANSVRMLSQPYSSIGEYELCAFYELKLLPRQAAFRFFKEKWLTDQRFCSVHSSAILELFGAFENLPDGHRVVRNTMEEVQEGIAIFYSWVDWETSLLDDFAEKDVERFLIDSKENFPIVESESEDYDCEELFSMRALLRNFREQDLDGVPYTCFLRKGILDALELLLGEIDGENTAVTVANERDFRVLLKELEQFLAVFQAPPSALDSLVDNMILDEEMEHAFAPLERKEYVQIPDHLEMQSFAGELQSFRTNDLTGLYKDASVEEILSLMNRRIGEVHNDTECNYPNSAVTPETVHRFQKLSWRLADLFKLNNGHTQVLDTVILNSRAFSDFEEKLKEKVAKEGLYAGADKEKETTGEPTNLPYLQVPDDFLLEEFAVELIQLRSELSQKFEGVSAKEVMSKLREMADNEKKYNLSKRITFSKLYRNLARLFSHNGNQTFVLDNVLLSSEVFALFEANKGWRNRPILAEVRRFFNENWEILNGVGAEMFSGVSGPVLVSGLVNLYAGTEENAAAKHFEKEYLLFHDTFEGFDALVKEVFSTGEGSLISLSEIENAYKAVVSSPKDSTSKVEEEDFLRSLLDEDKNPQFEPVEAEIKDALSIALNEKEAKDPEFEELKGLTAEDVRAKYTRSVAEDRELNKAYLEAYLKEASHEQQTQSERKIREKKAYEWSRNLAGFGSPHRHGFFSARRNGPRVNLLFPGLRNSLQYMLLTLDGKSVLSQQNPLGEAHPGQDMVTVLNRFSKAELAPVWRQIGTLQRKQWTLIGGGGDPEKMLVFARSGEVRSGTFFRLLKSAFAATGAVFLVLFGINVWLNEYKPPAAVERDVLEEEDHPLEFEEVVSVPEPLAGSSEPKEVQKGPFWKGLFWK